MSSGFTRADAKIDLFPRENPKKIDAIALGTSLDIFPSWQHTCHLDEYETSPKRKNEN
jgi:hypothetical protein